MQSYLNIYGISLIFLSYYQSGWQVHVLYCQIRVPCSCSFKNLLYSLSILIFWMLPLNQNHLLLVINGWLVCFFSNFYGKLVFFSSTSLFMKTQEIGWKNYLVRTLNSRNCGLCLLEMKIFSLEQTNVYGQNFMREYYVLHLL